MSSSSSSSGGGLDLDIGVGEGDAGDRPPGYPAMDADMRDGEVVRKMI